MSFPPPLAIALGAVAPFLSSTHISGVAAFVLPSSPPTTPSSLAYGPREDGDEEKRLSSASHPPSPFSANNDFERQLDRELGDPTCSIDDEDCLAFSSLDGAPLVFNADGANEDPLCDPRDVDCQAFLPKTYLNSNTHLAAELQTRSDSIQKERLDRNWRTAQCPTTFVRVSRSDWVRRVDMETYPVAVCGGASGGLYVVNLEEETTIAKAVGAHPVQVEQSDSNDGSGRTNAVGASTAKRAMEKLYGKLDGGGVVAVAIHGDLVASAGREGGVRLWRIVDNSQRDENVGGGLAPLGFLPGPEKTIVTSLRFDLDGLLWAAGYDGTVRAYDVTGYDDEDSASQFPPSGPKFQSDFTDSVLDMHLCEELKLGVCATADGGAALFSTEDGQFFVGIMLFEGGVAARSVLIVEHGNDGEGHSVLCGGANGVIHRIPLNVDRESGRVDVENPFAVSDATETAVKPKHTGPVMCMASAGEGTFVSGGQDGALRVWECSEEPSGDEGGDDERGRDDRQNKLRTKCMYALTGYKLWLGSACTDGKRLVSDGGENAVIVRDFSREPGTNGKASL